MVIVNLHCWQTEGRALGTRQKFQPSMRESDFTRQVVKHQSTCGVLRPQVNQLIHAVVETCLTAFLAVPEGKYPVSR